MWLGFAQCNITICRQMTDKRKAMAIPDNSYAPGECRLHSGTSLTDPKPMLCRLHVLSGNLARCTPALHYISLVLRDEGGPVSCSQVAFMG